MNHSIYLNWSVHSRIKTVSSHCVCICSLSCSEAGLAYLLLHQKKCLCFAKLLFQLTQRVKNRKCWGFFLLFSFGLSFFGHYRKSKAMSPFNQYFKMWVYMQIRGKFSRASLCFSFWLNYFLCWNNCWLKTEWPKKTMIGPKTMKILWIWSLQKSDVFIIDWLVSKNTAILLTVPNIHTLWILLIFIRLL